MKLLSKLSVASALVLSMFTYSASAKNNDDSVKVFYYSLNDLFINQLSFSLQDRAISSQIKLAQYDANEDLLAQIHQIENALALNNHKTPLLVNPVDTQNGSTALNLAQNKQIPIIFFNRRPDRDLLNNYQDAWYVGSDGTKAGVYQAQIVLDYIKDNAQIDRNQDGYINYVMIKGEATHQDTDARTGSFIRTMLESHVKLKPLASVNANWSQSKAQNLMQEIIDTKGIDNIELIVSNNDAMALGAIMALKNAGYNMNSTKFIPVVGIDALPSALDAIEKGYMIGTVLNDHKSMADVLIRMSEAYLKGEIITEQLIGHEITNHMINIPYVKVTKDNIDNVR